jgi:hypothetical protein
MADAAREHGRAHAADDVARDLLDLAGIDVKKGLGGSGGGPKTNGANGTSTSVKIRLDDGPGKGVS